METKAAVPAVLRQPHPARGAQRDPARPGRHRAVWRGCCDGGFPGMLQLPPKCQSALLVLLSSVPLRDNYNCCSPLRLLGQFPAGSLGPGLGPARLGRAEWGFSVPREISLRTPKRLLAPWLSSRAPSVRIVFLVQLPNPTQTQPSWRPAPSSRVLLGAVNGGSWTQPKV